MRTNRRRSMHASYLTKIRIPCKFLWLLQKSYESNIPKHIHIHEPTCQNRRHIHREKMKNERNMKQLREKKETVNEREWQKATTERIKYGKTLSMHEWKLYVWERFWYAVIMWPFAEVSSLRHIPPGIQSKKNKSWWDLHVAYHRFLSREFSTFLPLHDSLHCFPFFAIPVIFLGSKSMALVLNYWRHRGVVHQAHDILHFSRSFWIACVFFCICSVHK